MSWLGFENLRLDERTMRYRLMESQRDSELTTEEKIRVKLNNMLFGFDKGLTPDQIINNCKGKVIAPDGEKLKPKAVYKQLKKDNPLPVLNMVTPTLQVFKNQAAAFKTAFNELQNKLNSVSVTVRADRRREQLQSEKFTALLKPLRYLYKGTINYVIAYKLMNPIRPAPVNLQIDGFDPDRMFLTCYLDRSTGKSKIKFRTFAQQFSDSRTESREIIGYIKSAYEFDAKQFAQYFDKHRTDAEFETLISFPTDAALSFPNGSSQTFVSLFDILQDNDITFT